MPEAITFSKTKLFIGGHKQFGGYKCPMLGRFATNSSDPEYLYTYDCSADEISYNILWIDRRLDQLLAGSSEEKVYALATPTGINGDTLSLNTPLMVFVADAYGPAGCNDIVTVSHVMNK